MWARADRPSRMWVELERGRAGAGARRRAGRRPHGQGRAARPPARHDVPFRVVFEELRRPGAVSEPVAGACARRPADARGVSFLWSGDLAGQGWGINPDAGGIASSAHGRARRRTSSSISGDIVYADMPLAPSVALADGGRGRTSSRRRRRRSPRRSTSTAASYAYNLHGRGVPRVRGRACRRSTSGTTTRSRTAGTRRGLDDRGGSEQRVDVLAARAKQAFFDWVPTHPHGRRSGGRSTAGSPTARCSMSSSSTCGPSAIRTGRTGTPIRSAASSARRSAQWLERELAASTATWKVLANDLPLGLVIPDGPGPEAVRRARRPRRSAASSSSPRCSAARTRRRHGHGDADRRRPLRGGAPLRPGARLVPASSRRSGSSSPDR